MSISNDLAPGATGARGHATFELSREAGTQEPSPQAEPSTEASAAIASSDFHDGGTLSPCTDGRRNGGSKQGTDPVVAEIHNRGFELAELLLPGPHIVEGRNAVWSVPWREDKKPSLKVLRETANGRPAGSWKDWGSNEGGDVLALLSRIHGLDVRRDFATVKAKACRLLGIAQTDTTSARMLSSVPNRDVLAAGYGLQWSDFADAGCEWQGDHIAYPVRLTGRVGARKFKSTARDQYNKRASWGEKGSGFQRGLFDLGLADCRDATLVVAGGEEKAIAAKVAGRAAVSPAAGEHPLSEMALSLIVAAHPACVVMAFDADETGRSATVTCIQQLRAAGITNVRAVAWPAGVPAKYDLTDYLVAHGVESVRDLLDAAPQATEAVEVSPARTESEWPDVVPLNSSTGPQFPLHALDGSPWLRNFVEGVAVSTQTPADMAGLLSLAAIGAALAGRVEIHVKEGWTQPPNLFAAVFLPPGERKTAAISEVAAPLYDCEQYLVASTADARREMVQRERVLKQRQSVLERRAAKANDEAERGKIFAQLDNVAKELAEIPPHGEPRVLADDVTPEQLATLLLNNKGRMAVFASEASLLEVALGRYSNDSPRLEVLLKAWDGKEALRVDRRERTEYVPAPLLSLGLAVQPDVLDSLAGSGKVRGRGLLGRFLLAVPQSMLGSRRSDPPVLPHHARSLYHTNVRRLFEILPNHLEPYPLHFSAGAWMVLRDYNDGIEQRLGPEGDLACLSDFAGKLVGTLARVAGILHMAATFSHEKPVEAATVEAALALGPYLVEHFKVALGIMGHDAHTDNARHVLSWIKRNGKRAFTGREAWQALKSRSRFAKTKEVEAALRALEDHGFVFAESPPPRTGAGRPPSTRFNVNPRIYDGPA